MFKSKLKEFKKEKKKRKCPNDYRFCNCYHPEQYLESRCIKGSKISFCIIELKDWIKMNKKISH